MTRRFRLLAVVAALALLVAACGGDTNGSDDGGDGDAGSDSGTSQDGGSQDTGGTADGTGGQDPDDDASSDGDSGDDGTSTGSGGPPDLDPGDMPPAGTVVFEIDGQTFTISADDMDYFICDIADDFVNVRSESGTQDVTVQFDPVNGLGNAGLTVEGSDVVYNSFFGPATSGGATAEAPYVVYEGEFDTTTAEDPLGATPVGIGRVLVTCP